MKSAIVEIIEWYNGKGKLIQHTIIYESGMKCGCFENLPKTAEKWMKEAKCFKESKEGNWTKKVYRKHS